MLQRRPGSGRHYRSHILFHLTPLYKLHQPAYQPYFAASCLFNNSLSELSHNDLRLVALLPFSFCFWLTFHYLLNLWFLFRNHFGNLLNNRDVNPLLNFRSSYGFAQAYRRSSTASILLHLNNYTPQLCCGWVCFRNF